MIVNSSQGGGFKDTWVLAKDTGVEHDSAPGSESINLLAQSRKHSLALVTASKADNLYWLGRYTERVFTTLNQFFPFYDRVMDTDVDAFRPFAHRGHPKRDLAEKREPMAPGPIRSASRGAITNARGPTAPCVLFSSPPSGCL